MNNDGNLRKQEFELKVSRESADRLASGAKFVADHQVDIHSEKPETRCRMQTLLRIYGGEEIYASQYPRLRVPAADCDKSSSELQRDAERQVRLKQGMADGAPEGFVRRDPGGTLQFQECSVTTQNLHGRTQDGTCTLVGLPPSAVIYKTEYLCLEFRCGWSYNPDGGYGPKVVPADDGKSIRWSRRWDGDPVTERYRYYYQMKPDA